MDYLDNGGNLYIESVDIGNNYQSTAFFDYFGIEYKGDGGYEEVVSLEGKATGAEELLKFFYLGDYSAHYSVDNLKASGGMDIMSSEEGTARMLVNETNDYKVISSSVVFAAMANSDSLNYKPYMLCEFINYFLGYNPVTNLANNISTLFEQAIYPNPFSSQATISYSIDKAQNVSIAIYNMNGQMISLLENTTKLPGRHQVKWDGSSNSGEVMPDGNYFVRITTGETSDTKKIILLR